MLRLVSGNREREEEQATHGDDLSLHVTRRSRVTPRQGGGTDPSPIVRGCLSSSRCARSILVAVYLFHFSGAYTISVVER